MYLINLFCCILQVQVVDFILVCSNVFVYVMFLWQEFVWQLWCSGIVGLFGLCCLFVNVGGFVVVCFNICVGMFIGLLCMVLNSLFYVYVFVLESLLYGVVVVNVCIVGFGVCLVLEVWYVQMFIWIVDYCLVNLFVYFNVEWQFNVVLMYIEDVV